MRKVLFLMFLLLLMGLGAAGVKAQVRIGGNGAPQGAAVLYLNADNTATPTANKGALALPRVSLASNTAQLNGTAPITGMLVYNTNATLGVGIYFYNGSNWVPIDGDGIIGNEVTNATANGGLVRAGSGTASSPYTLGIAPSGVTTTMLAPAPVNNSVLVYVSNAWHTATDSMLLSAQVPASPGRHSFPVNLSRCVPGEHYRHVFTSTDGDDVLYAYFDPSGTNVIVVNTASSYSASIGVWAGCYVLN